MNKLEIGMYVRTKKRMFQPPQIAKIKKIIKDNDYKNQYYIELDHNLIPNYEYYIYQEDILKTSFNIIDLIEVGDYVNGQKVVAIHEHYVWDEEDIGTALETEHEYTAILNEDIKSIVTKEQFEGAKYEIE